MALPVVISFMVARFHLRISELSPLAADYPFLDALTTVMSFVAMFLMARRRTESWVYWIVVDDIAIGLYWVKNVRFISLQYVVHLEIAIYGLVNCVREEHAAAVPAQSGHPSRLALGP